MERFSEGLAAAKKGPLAEKLSWRYGYIDKTGALVIQPQFDLADPFVGGVASVRFTIGVWGGGYDKVGYIDRSGRYIWKPSY